jgi:DNA repair protein RecO (recombination protein O)
MLHKTRGIVFRFTRYGETSIIVTIFTEVFGIQTYIVNGVRSKSAKNKIALYQPLTLLDLVVYHKENASILRIKELQCAHPYQTLTVDVKKSTLALFLNELLNRTVKEQSHPGEIFSFLFDSLVTLDLLSEQYKNFHLSFLIKLSRFLGFGANFSEEILGARLVDDAEEAILKQLITSDYQANVIMTNTQRRSLLDVMLRFYRQHVDGFGEMKSVQILREVLG